MSHYLPKEAQAPAEWLTYHLEGPEQEMLMDLLCALEKNTRQRRRDHEADLDRRVLVGPRLPRWQVNRYRQAARAQGVSLYRWATDALEAHLMATDGH